LADELGGRSAETGDPQEMPPAGAIAGQLALPIFLLM